MLGMKLITQKTWDKIQNQILCASRQVHRVMDEVRALQNELNISKVAYINLVNGKQFNMNIELVCNHIDRLKKKGKKLTKIVMSPGYMLLFKHTNQDIITAKKRNKKCKTRYYLNHLELVEDKTIIGWYIK